MVIVKARSAAYEWPVYHSSLPAGQGLFLSYTTAAGSVSSQFNWGGIGGANSSTFTCTQGVTTINNTNLNGTTYVAYCFAPVVGYSSAFSYTGNGSSSGPFVYLGFRPRFFFVKRTDAAGDWWVYDAARNPYNVSNYALRANSSAAEVSDVGLDMLSNGFKYVNDLGAPNLSGATYVGFAFAEHPFAYARAR